MVAGTKAVLVQQLRAGDTLLELLDQAAVNGPDLRIIELANERLANAVVVEIHLVGGVAGPEEVRESQARDQRPLVPLEAGGAEREPRVQRLTRHGEHAHQLRRAVGHLPQPRPQHLREAERLPGARSLDGQRGPHHLVEQERIAVGLLREHRRPLVRLGPPCPQHPQRVVDGVLARERPDLQRAPGAAGRAGEQLGQERRVPDVLGTEAQEEEHAARRRRLQQVVQDVGAVAVGPLEIVDQHHERGPLPDDGQQLAQGRERPAPELALIRQLEVHHRAPLDRLHPPQNGEDAAQRWRVAWQFLLDDVGGQGPQQPAEHVDNTVERLVGHRLTDEAAPVEHDRKTLRRQARP